MQLDTEVWSSRVRSGDEVRGLIIYLCMVTKTMGIIDGTYEKCVSGEMDSKENPKLHQL